MSISQATYQDADLVLKLYEMRREERMRTARAWYFANFKVQSLSEMMEKFPPGSDPNASFRMVTSYWDMAASFVVRGVLHEELFFENNTEMLVVWERVKGIIGEFRKSRNNPLYLRNLEKAAEKYVLWMNANAPGAYETFQGFVNPKSSPGIVKSDDLEIGRILYLKLEIKNPKLDWDLQKRLAKCPYQTT